MKKRTILYYPTIDVPTNSWLRNSLLYWDEISSIVPQSWNNNYRNNLSPDINYLIDEGQFRAIRPDELIERPNNWEVLQTFQNEFKEIVLSQTFQKFIKRSEFHRSRIHINKIDHSKMSARVHENKTSHAIFYFLEDLGLASRKGNYDEWFYFERHTALIYMSLLAKYLADIDKEQTTIGTNYGVYEKFNFKRVDKKEGFPIISLNLSNALPTPMAHVPLEKIIDFKYRRKDELINFRRILMDLQNKISKAKSNQELNEVIVSFQESLQVGIKNLKKTAKDYKLETWYKSLNSLINLKSPALWTSAATILDEKYSFLHQPLAVKLIGISSLAFIQLRGSYVEVRNKQLTKTRDSAFSYLLNAQNARILKPLR